jgi:hypothetical protein
VAGVCQGLALPRVNFPRWDEVPHSLGALPSGHALTHADFGLLRDAWLATEIDPQLGRFGMGLGVAVAGPTWKATRGAKVAAWLLSIGLAS